MAQKYSLTLDGLETITSFGVYLAEGSLAGLLNLPPVEEDDLFNDWHERNGVEVHTHTPALVRDTFGLNFIVPKNRVQEFTGFLKSKPVHTLAVPELSAGDGWEVIVRHREKNVEDMGDGLRLLALDFCRYRDPAEPETETADGTEFFTKLHGLGFKELRGTRAEMEKGSEVKDHLPGQTKALTFEPYDITLPIFYNGTGVMGARKRLLAFLVQKGERVLNYDGRTIKAVYKSNHSETLLPYENGAVWWEFDLTMMATSF